ncbi:peptidoglycan amidohydrolase family protein [Enterococcus xiangfangensis]|uniref:peptidoglycan amidohydrolase family protein n=1 Tax=Enterococcus xiangfangensis TaxID=1296537 RepID=UPI00142DC633|nr:peptidoglycan amidohydrolase family protein [Enterococcus xiangfangensis]MBM7711164.1 hypothetical protein [Enterococcus xiangfangensis]
MEKKRFKMYKKKRTWVIAPIIFLGMLGAAAFSADSNAVYADEVTTDQAVQIVEQTPIETANSDIDSTDNINTSSEEEILSDTAETSNQGTTISTSEQGNDTESSTDSTETNPSESSSTNDATEVTDPSTNETTDNDVNSNENSDSAAQEISTNKTESATTESTESEQTPVITSKVPAGKAPTQNKSTTTTVKKAKALTVKASSAKATPKAVSVPKISIFRVYNPNSGEHLHTMNSYEKDYLVRLGWRYEGVSMVVSNSGKQLLRIYNPNSGEHHFTLNSNEINMLKRAGWRYEGVAWLTPNSGIAMYRVFNPNARGAGSHHYTMNVNERNRLLNAGWRNEGVSWYTLGTKSKQEVMLDWFYARQGKVTYSTAYRNGPNSYDCSSAVFYSLIEAGYLSPQTWIGNTDTLFSYEGKLFKAISRNEVRRGDIFVAGKKGGSGGAFGHTGVATSNSKIIHCNYTDNGISETVILNRTGDPCYWFRFI